MKSLSTLATCSLLLAACAGDDADPDPADDPDASAPDAAPAVPDAPAAARVEVTIAYEGAAVGTALAAAFSSFPPRGGPIAFAQDATPVFPQALTLEGLPGSTVYVLGFLDVAPASPTQPGPEDLTAWSDAMVLVEGQSATLTLTLEDP